MKAETYYHIPKPNAHCATICPIKTGVLLAYYTGPECTDQQKVNILHKERNKNTDLFESVDTIVLPELTGNCVLIPTEQDKATLIFSYFKDTDGVERATSPVQRWMFCANYKTIITLDSNGISHGPILPLGLQPEIGLLTRCAPIQHNKKWLLPIYTEHNCYGVIAESKDGFNNWKERGKIGKTERKSGSRFGSGILIQPTIWSDEEGLHSLSRDITPNCSAWYSHSDNGRDWSEPIQTKVDNRNNSLVAIQGTQLIVWNKGMGRAKLMLGKFDKKTLEVKPILKLNYDSHMANASYPNYCFDVDENLHIVHTDCGKIAHHIIDKEMLLYLQNSNEQIESLTSLKDWKIC